MYCIVLKENRISDCGTFYLFNVHRQLFFFFFGGGKGGGGGARGKGRATLFLGYTVSCVTSVLIASVIVKRGTKVLQYKTSFLISH